MMRETERVVRPPGVVTTITAGFDLTTKHLWLLLIPIMLDIFLWLGPRLSFGLIVERMIGVWQRELSQAGVDVELLLELAPRTNLFTSLGVPIVGVPAYLGGLTPERTPLPAATFELESIWLWGILFAGLSLLGLWLTCVYFGLIARAVRNPKELDLRLLGFLGSVMRSWVQLVGVILLAGFGLFLLYIPLLLVSSLLAFLSQGLAMLILFMGPMLVIWLVFYLFFVPHGLILGRRPIWRAVIESVQIVQRYLLPTMGLLASILVISQGLDWVLLIAEDGSWFTLISIVGHAFISTALIVSTFLYYRDRSLVLLPIRGGQKRNVP